MFAELVFQWEWIDLCQPKFAPEKKPETNTGFFAFNQDCMEIFISN